VVAETLEEDSTNKTLDPAASEERQLQRVRTATDVAEKSVTLFSILTVYIPSKLSPPFLTFNMCANRDKSFR
jgi:hypothetical protein